MKDLHFNVLLNQSLEIRSDYAYDEKIVHDELEELISSVIEESLESSMSEYLNYDLAGADMPEHLLDIKFNVEDLSSIVLNDDLDDLEVKVKIHAHSEKNDLSEEDVKEISDYLTILDNYLIDSYEPFSISLSEDESLTVRFTGLAKVTVAEV